MSSIAVSHLELINTKRKTLGGLMKKILCIMLSSIFVSGLAQADVFGTWRTAEGDSGGYAVVEIAPCEDNSSLVCGTITDIVDSDDTSSIGKQIIADMKILGDGKYRGGQIWAPDEDKWYSARMVLDGATLKVSGCVFGGLVCRGQDWTALN